MADLRQSAPLPGDGPLLPEPLPREPFALLAQWLDSARAAALQPNPNAFSLATVDGDGRPSARIVLCKGIDANRGTIRFFTSYTSRKSRALDAQSRGAGCFHWDALDRQARFEGTALRTSDAESDAYFASRPWQSRIGAWASDQSEPVASRHAMIERVASAMRRFGLDPDRPPASDAQIAIPRPSHWGGWDLVADRVELWMGGVGRVHDRAVWIRSGPNLTSASPWASTRLQP